MKLISCKLGEHIQLLNNKNSDLKFGIDSVKGVNNSKELISTKADLTTRDLSKFQIVNPNEFVFNHRTSRNGNKFSITCNNTNEPIICTEDYTVFKIKEDSSQTIHVIWLLMYFKRAQFDRYVITNSWGSSTEFFNWDDLCNINIKLPSYEIQLKYVAIYQALINSSLEITKSLNELKMLCSIYIEHLKKDITSEKIGNYIYRKNERNKLNEIDIVFGLSTKKEFRIPQNRVNKDNLQNYKIVNSDDIVYVPTTDTWKVLAVAINDKGFPFVVSPIYEVFSVDKNKILPKYLMLWFTRDEFDRYARYNSWGSARENFSWEEMSDVKIPIPDLEVQQDIVNIYNAYLLRKDINKKMQDQLANICSILIKGSLEE